MSEKVQCQRCRVTVPVAALADPNRCPDKTCPLLRVAEALKPKSAERAA